MLESIQDSETLQPISYCRGQCGFSLSEIVTIHTTYALCISHVSQNISLSWQNSRRSIRTLQRPADSALIGRNQRTTRAAYSLSIQHAVGVRSREFQQGRDNLIANPTVKLFSHSSPDTL